MNESKSTTYVVFGNTDEGWLEAGRVQATSAKHAISQVADETGTYVAVPARSFQPAQVTVQQQAKVSFGEPKAETTEPPA